MRGYCFKSTVANTLAKAGGGKSLFLYVLMYPALLHCKNLTGLGIIR